MSHIEKKAAIAEYRRLYEALNSLILAWDPYGLFKSGELSDEFSDEVTQILAKLPYCQSEADVAREIQAVFAISFSDHEFTLSACEPIANTVHSWWSAQA